METERIASLENTARTVKDLTRAYQAAMLEIVNHSDLHEKAAQNARVSINNDDVLVDVLSEFDEYITDLKGDNSGQGDDRDCK